MNVFVCTLYYIPATGPRGPDPTMFSTTLRGPPYGSVAKVRTALAARKGCYRIWGTAQELPDFSPARAAFAPSERKSFAVSADIFLFFFSWYF